MTSTLLEQLQTALGDSYVVERELGGGGMSRVFLAAERSLGRRVVIKVLPPELVSGVSEARFQREILVTASLQHPHILPVLAAGARHGLLYYVTPYVEGLSLRERIAFEGRLPLTDVASILREVSSALAYAHARGVIHRDVKPENVLLSGGHAVLADFGIARAVAQATQTGRLTGTGLGLGTPGYMAPEQLAGDPTVDARADVYALGVLAYEMLAGRPPFTGPTPQALAAAYFTHTPQPLEELRPEIPPALAAVISCALAKTPEERFATAAAFRDALLPACDALLTTPDVAARAGGGRRRRRVGLSALAALAVIGLVAVGVLGSRLRPRGEAGEASGRKTLVVLPFKNLGRPEDAYFTDGITEELTSRLASLSELGVISRTSADQYRTSTKPLRQIARELGAEYVLEGSVRWDRAPSGRGRVRVTPQLIRVRDDSHLWADRYDGELNDVFEVQSRIAERVAAALAVTLGAGERQQMDARPTQNLAAYDSYMRGERLRTREGMNPAALTQAVDLLGQAVTADPQFALAFAKLSLANQMLYDMYLDRTPDRLARARAAADSALALDPSLPEAHLAIGRHFESQGDIERAGAEYALAERGRPNDGAILARTAAILARRGRWADALARLERAAEFDPRSVEANLSAAEAFGLTRNYATAMRYVERARAADPDVIDAYALRAWLEMTLGGDRAKARETAREIVLRFGAERSAAANGFDKVIASLDTTDLVTLARVSPSAFGGNRIAYLYWRVVLFEHWHPERARAHADSLIEAGRELIRTQREDYGLHAALGWIFAVQGRREEGSREARRSLELMPMSRDPAAWADVAQMAARTFVRAGELDAAVDQLEQLLNAPSWISVPALRADPTWDPLRGHPRFQQLLARGA